MLCPYYLLPANSGADDQDRTGDLVLTKDVLCQLSYIGLNALRLRRSGQRRRRGVERETGIEPATNSLEGCDSTTELLPPSRAPTCRSDFASSAPIRSRQTRSDNASALSAVAAKRRQENSGGFPPLPANFLLQARVPLVS